MKFRIFDSRGKFSWTHTIAIPIVLAVTLKLLISGVSLSYDGHSITLASMSASDYVEIVKYWLGIFFARETTSKVIDYLRDKNGSSNP